ncbi:MULTISPECIES: tetratricopeptide repeat protein [Micromonospora]|uniref:tetratricopeptide repeat protein n=1 Tax=Micromonospora TaxID=1873 RepID=UPI001EE84F37|nr:MULTISPECIES: tetratricopeptide repeat protein [Micromonospora]MCG5453326.1 tetratricopeptide repeat protein [Micromonospora hortensis]MCX5119185.1 tetratricopeptide repeat protein [Micromonospora sp. NBC_00362]
MNMRQIFGSLACGAVLLTGVTACSSDKPAEKPQTNNAGSTDKTNGGTETPADLLKLGLEQGQAGNFDAAKATFEKLLDAEADNKFAWFNLGYIAQSRNQADEAISNYDKALEADANYKPALYNKAIVLEGKAPTTAIDIYRKIVSIDNKASTAYLRLGMMLSQSGEDATARDAFKTAIRLDKGLTSAVPAKYRPTPTSKSSTPAGR